MAFSGDYTAQIPAQDSTTYPGDLNTFMVQVGQDVTENKNNILLRASLDAPAFTGVASFAGNTSLNADVTIGTTGGDTLTVNSDSNFLNDVILGSSSADTITINGVPTFNNGITLTSAASTIMNFQQTDAAADEDWWRFQAIGGNFNFETVNDAYNTAVQVFQVSRTGTTVDLINFKPTALQHNGDVIVTEGSTNTMTSKTLTSPVLNTGVSGSAIDTTVTTSTTKVPRSSAVKTYVEAARTQIMLGKTGTISGARNWYRGFSDASLAASTFTNAAETMPAPGTVRNLYVKPYINDSTSGSCVFTLYKNGLVTGLTVTVPNSSVAEQTDLVNTVDFVAGDELAWNTDNSTGNSTIQAVSISTEILLT